MDYLAMSRSSRGFCSRGYLFVLQTKHNQKALALLSICNAVL